MEKNMSFIVTQIWILEVYPGLEVKGRLIGMILPGRWRNYFSDMFRIIRSWLHNRKTPKLNVITVLKFFTGDVLSYCLNPGYST